MSKGVKEKKFGVYRGFLPMWIRTVPQVTIQLIIYDKLLILSGLHPL